MGLFAVGILPGLGGATTLALMLPFIYNMDPITAFAFLLGSNAVTATTGDVTSVLFGVPGEGICAATIVDGHPMAKQGEAGRALGAALMSSLFGAVFGAFMLAQRSTLPACDLIAQRNFSCLRCSASLLGLSAARTFLKDGWLAAWALCSRCRPRPIESVPRLLSKAFWATKRLFLGTVFAHRVRSDSSRFPRS